MRRFLFLAAIVIALMMASCSSGDYKSYVPGDSKVIGKIDLKEFFAQTGVDQEKLFKSLADEYGDDVASIKDMGVDLAEPFYIFVNGKGTDFTFGLVGKIQDKEKFLAWCKKQDIGDKFKSGESDYSYFADKGAGLAVNDEALVLVGSSDNDESSIKKSITKVMEKEGDAKLSDNALFNKADGTTSFACLYADMSIIPGEMVSQAQMQSGVEAKDLEEIRDMVIGIDGSAKNGICDFAWWAKSEKSSVQKKLDESMKALGRITDKALDSFSADDVAGFAMNADMSKMVEKLKEKFGSNAQFAQIINTLSTILDKIKGNVIGKMDMASNFVIAAESQNTTNEINSLMSESGMGDEAPFSYGFNGNFMCFVPKGVSPQNALTRADNKISSDLTDFMKEHRQVMFVNVDKLSSFSSQIGDSDSKKALNAFSPILDKVKFVTLSCK